MPRDYGGSMTVFQVKDEDVEKIVTKFKAWDEKVYASADHEEFCKENKVRTKWFCFVNNRKTL